MKKNYLKPEFEEVIEMPALTIMELSPTDDEKPGGKDEDEGFGAPRWRKW